MGGVVVQQEPAERWMLVDGFQLLVVKDAVQRSARESGVEVVGDMDVSFPLQDEACKSMSTANKPWCFTQLYRLKLNKKLSPRKPVGEGITEQGRSKRYLPVPTDLAAPPRAMCCCVSIPFAHR